MTAALDANVSRTANVDSATWVFAAPAGESLAGATLWRAGDVDGGAELDAWYQFWLAGSGETDIFDSCVALLECPGLGVIGEPLSPTNRLVVPSANLGSHLYAGAACGGTTKYKCLVNAGDPNGYAAVVYVYAADLILEQEAGPTASNVSGELASASTVSGTSDVAFSASDPGSGVYEAVFSVDGQVVQRTVVDEDGGRCRNVGETTDGLPAFLYVQPCLASVNADVGLETTRITNGTHHLVVSVIDAAGNADDGARQEHHGRELSTAEWSAGQPTGRRGRTERDERVSTGDADGGLEGRQGQTADEWLRPSADDRGPADGS